MQSATQLGTKGYNIRTVTGRYVDLSKPDPDAVDVVDMAHALGHITRFLGHVRSPVTVLEHLLNSYDRAREVTARDRFLTPPESEDIAFASLLHDAHECYVCDIPTPLKALIGESYKVIEDGWQAAVFDWASLPLELAHHPIVVQVDREMLLTEARDFHGASLDELKIYWPAGEPIADFLDRRELSSARARFVRLVTDLQNSRMLRLFGPPFAVTDGGVL
jgi:hypothetical protein